MVTNSHSKGCIRECSFDKYIKEQYFPAWSYQHITLCRQAFTDDTIRNKFIDSLKIFSNDSLNSWEDMEAIIDSINIKLAKKEDLSASEKEIAKVYAESINAFWQEVNNDEALKKRMAAFGTTHSSKATAYNKFRSVVPAKYRQEVISQIISMVIDSLDYLETAPKFANMTRQEILNYEDPQQGLVLEVLLNRTKNRIKNAYKEHQEIGDLDKETTDMFDALLYDNDAWGATLSMCKDLLFNVEHLIIDTKYGYVFDAEDEDMNVPNPEDDAPQSAEETGAEHWQLKSDTVSAFASMAREVRSILYKLPGNGEGIFGVTNITDAMLLHQNLLSLRADKYCSNSDEFIESLKSMETTWNTRLSKKLEDASFTILDNNGNPKRAAIPHTIIAAFRNMSNKEVELLYHTLSKSGKGIIPALQSGIVSNFNEVLSAIDNISDATVRVEVINTINRAFDSLGCNWASKLAYILETDPYARSMVFTTYKKNHQYYVYHNKKAINVDGRRVSKFFRNKSGINSTVLLNHYVANALDIPHSKANICIFKRSGSVNQKGLETFLSILKDAQNTNFWDNDNSVYRAELYLANKTIDRLTDAEKLENKRNFIFYINDALNLHLSHEDVESLMNTQHEFKSFCVGLAYIVEALKDKTLQRGNVNALKALIENSNHKKYFKKLLKASVHTINYQDRTSPIERTFRYNKGSYVAHTVPNALGDTLERIGKAASKGSQALREYLEETYLQCPLYAKKTTVESRTEYTIYNEWLRRLYNATDKDLKNPASWANQFINNLTRGLGVSDRAFEDFMEKDNYVFSLNEYMYTYADSVGNLGVVPLFVTGDSNATRYITTPIMSTTEIKSRMVDVAFQEIERMNMFQGILDWCEDNGYSVSNGHDGTKKGDEYYDSNPLVKNANKFTFLPFLNENTVWENPNTGEVYTSWREAYDKIGATDATRLDFRAILYGIIEQALEEKYKDFEKTMLEKDIAIQKFNGIVVNDKTLYVENCPANSDVNFLRNFYYNTKFNLIQQLQMFTVDPGFYNGTEDMQKRYKEMIASGEVLDKTAIDPSSPTGEPVDNNHGHQNVWYFNEMLRDSEKEDPAFIMAIAEHGLNSRALAAFKNAKEGERIAALKAYADANRGTSNWTYTDEATLANLKKYTKNTLTDGQGYRSFTSYRKILIMRGRWSKEAEKVYKIIMDNRMEHARKVANGEAAPNSRPRLSREQLREIDRLGVVFQPLKPFYYGFEKLTTDRGEALIPVQHKYSEFPVIPELLPADSKLGALGWAMENNKAPKRDDQGRIKKDDEGNPIMEDCPIDLATCTTTVKVGGFGSFNIDGCTTAEEIQEVAKSGYIHKLDLDGWRQQSNVPEHTDCSRARGTQFIKHGYGCIAGSTPKSYRFLQKFTNGVIKLTKNSSITLKNGTIDQPGMIKLYSTLGSSGYIKSALSLFKTLSTPESCSEVLSEMRANDSRGANDDLGAYDINNGEFNLPPCEGLRSADNLAALLSLGRKEIIKQRMKGGSVVQVSAYGMDDVLKVHTETMSDGKTNIIYADCARAFDYSITTADGKTIKLDYFDFVDPETGMLLGIDGVTPIDQPADVDNDHKYYGWNTKLGAMYPGILDMLAYRIPTEKDYSILNLKAKRFFHKSAGGIMMVPSQYTTIAGFDFDIDKLYFVQREYKFSTPNNLYSNWELWSEFYNNDPIGKKIFPYLERAYKESNSFMEGYEEDDKVKYKEYYKYWSKALETMIAEGEDVVDIPKDYTDAFLKFVYSSKKEDGTYTYVTLKSDYSEDIPIFDQSQEAINNFLFDFYQERLEDYDTFNERYTPGGPIQLKKYLPVMLALDYASPEELVKCDSLEKLLELSKKFEDYSHPYDPTELSTIAHYQTYNAIYDKLIGIAANQNINQRYTSLLEKITLKEAIKFGSLTLCPNIDEDAGRNIKARIVNGIDTELFNTEFLSSAVDAVKNALLEYYGVSDSNFNATCLLSKIGASPIDIGLLLKQPVVIKAMEIIKESSISKNISSALDEALQSDDFFGSDKYEDLSKRFYSDIRGESNGSKKRDEFVGSDTLVRCIVASRTAKFTGIDLSSDMDYLRSQYAVAELMKEIVDAASELSDQVSTSKSTSTNSVSSDLGVIENTELKIRSFIQRFGTSTSMFDIEVVSAENNNGTAITEVIDPDIRFSDVQSAVDVIDRMSSSPYCMEQVAYSAIMTFVDNVIGSLFPYRNNGFMALKTSLADLTKNKILSADLCTAVNKEAMLFLLERMTEAFSESTTVKLLSTNGEEIETNIPNRIFYRQLFSYYLKQILLNNKNMIAHSEEGTVEDYSQIPILGGLTIEAEQYGQNKRNELTGQFIEVIKFPGIGSLQGFQKDPIIESWQTMFENLNDPILKQLAEHLLKYSYYSRGFNFGETSVMSLAPVDLKTQIFDKEYATFFNRVFNISRGSLEGTLQENGLGDDTVSNISMKDFMKSFILIHSKEFCFTKDLTKTQKSKLKGIIPGGMTADNLEVTDDVFVDRIQKFTINFADDKIRTSALKNLGTVVKNEKGDITSVIFTPCIKIGDALYICDRNLTEESTQFNVSRANMQNEKLAITYYRMDLPNGLDYSKPQLYGTRAAELAASDNKDILIQIEAMSLAFQQEQAISRIEGGDTENSSGGSVIESQVNEAINRITQTGGTIDTLIKTFANDSKGAPFRVVKSDFIASLETMATTIKKTLDTVKDTDSIDKQIEILTEFLDSDTIMSPISFYIENLERALQDGITVFDFETSGAGKDEAKIHHKAGIAQIGAFTIKNGQVSPDSYLNIFVELQPGHYVAEFFDEGTPSQRKNPIYDAYMEAKREGKLISEERAITKLKRLFGESNTGLGHNSISFDSEVLKRRDAAITGNDPTSQSNPLNSIRHFDTMSIGRLALYDKGLPNYTRETITEWFNANMPGFKEDIARIKAQLGAENVSSHDAVNDVIETYCIAKYSIDLLKTSLVVNNTQEHRALIASLTNLKLLLQKAKIVQEKQNKEQATGLNEQADNAPCQIDSEGKPVCG